MRWLILISFLFYSLNVTGFNVKNFVLVESCIKTEPLDMAYWAPYLACLIAFWIWPDTAQWILLGFFSLSALILFLTTVRFMIWPNERKIRGYNQYFKSTHHIIKPSDTKLIPDTFHLILLVLVPVNLIGIIIYIIL
ncbi:MAG: hypothetical protein FWE90_10525 [Defluviitaleaceae bacterium]|nr:hypothetical protein [Defluviitaleaceae bacterium]